MSWEQPDRYIERSGKASIILTILINSQNCAQKRTIPYLLLYTDYLPNNIL